MGKRRAPSLRQKLKCQIDRELSVPGLQVGAQGLSEADLERVLSEQNRKNFYRYELIEGVDPFGEPIVSYLNNMERRPHFPAEVTRRKTAGLRQQAGGQSEIAKVIGISLPTLCLNYPNEPRSSSQTCRRHVPNYGERKE